MKFHSIRRPLLAGVLAFITAALVASCGGGGAAPSTQGGVVQILPASGSIYAGVPTTFNIVGGRAPYTVVTSEPALLPVPSTVTGSSFTVVANNTGVVDVGQDPTQVPSRQAIITVRDSSGSLNASGTYNVLRNFLTGYGFSFAPNTCTVPTGTTTAAGSITAGCEVGIQFNATTNGNLFGDRPFRIDVIRGSFFLIDPVTGANGNSVTIRSDHSGVVHAVMRTVAGAPTQVAVIRITDVATGVYTDTLFTIVGGSSAALLTAIPSALTFTGPNTATCGTGDADVFVFDGVPPYSVASTSPNVVAFAVDANNNPGIFRVRAVNPNVCLTDAQVIFTDRFGARVTITVNTVPGATDPPAPPPPPVTPSPNTITLGCGQSGSVSVTGGVPPYSASSATPGITAVVTGNTVTITRAAAGTTGATTPTTTSTVNISDGNTVGAVSVTSPTTCP